MYEPDGVNRLDVPTLRSLRTLFQSFKRDPNIHGVVLYGRDAFCAGGDLREIAKMNPLEAKRYIETGREALLEIAHFPKPTVAALHGYALGGGLELALATTFRIATPTTLLGHPAIQIGVFPGYVGFYFLGRTVKFGILKKLILLGPRIPAQEAFRFGIVQELVDRQEDLLSRAILRARMLRKPLIHGS